MAWIRTIPPEDAVDELRKVYTEIDARGKIAAALADEILEML